MNPTLTSVLAVIGTVTGTASLLIKFSEWLRSRPKIKCYQPMLYKNWIVEVENKYSSNFLTDDKNKFVHFSKSERYNFAIIPINLVNQSSVAVTIYDISTNCNALNFDKRFNYYLKPISYGENLNKRYTYNSLKSIDLPLRIEPFDSFECSILIYYFPDETCKINHMKLRLQSSNKKFKYTAKKFTIYGKDLDESDN